MAQKYRIKCTQGDGTVSLGDYMALEVFDKHFLPWHKQRLLENPSLPKLGIVPVNDVGEEISWGAADWSGVVVEGVERLPKEGCREEDGRDGRSDV